MRPEIVFSCVNNPRTCMVTDKQTETNHTYKTIVDKTVLLDKTILDEIILDETTLDETVIDPPNEII